MSRLSLRVVLFPALVIAVAIGVSWWGGRQGDAAAERIRSNVTTWCAAAGRGEDPARNLPAASFITRPLGAALVHACAPAPDRVRVEVAAGPGPGHHAVKASHHALVLRDSVPMVGINFLVSGDQANIVGYWKEY